MRREEALDLIPLLVADDLEPEAAAEVEAALADDPEGAALRAEHQSLHALLEQTLGRTEEDEEPEWLRALAERERTEGTTPAEPAPAPAEDRRARGLVRCPYCHDALGEVGVALCAACGTPHHEGCFAENAGCSLLGCGGAEWLTGAADASRPCPGCARSTPARAPYCAWCGERLGEAAPPRHHRPRRREVLSRGRYLAAAALLAISTLGLGFLLGAQEATTLRAYHLTSRAEVAAQAEREVQELLLELHFWQAAFLRDDLDGDGVRDFACSLAEVEEAIRRTPHLDGDPVPLELRYAPIFDRYEVSLGVAAPGGFGFWVVAHPRPGSGLEERGYFINQRGALEVYAADQVLPEVDPRDCTLMVPSHEATAGGAR